MKEWLMYFRKNRGERANLPWHSEPIWQEIVTLPRSQREALIASLGRFEVGESGEGKRLKAGAASTGSAMYQEMIDLFLTEEHDHAAWLGKMIDALQGEHLAKHWSDGVFIVLRHMGGLQTELMILLVAEMIAQKYYSVLYEKIDHPLCRAVFGQICQDEDGHVAFHCAYLNDVFGRQSSIERWTTRLLWYALYRAACVVVAWDHREILRECQVSFSEFWRDTGAIFQRTADRIFGHSPLLYPAWNGSSCVLKPSARRDQPL